MMNRSRSPRQHPASRATYVGLALLALALSGCGGETADTPAETPAPVAEAPSGPRVLGRAPRFILTDQDGKAFDSTSLFGRVWVATFMFVRCRGTCPRQASCLAEVQERLQDDPRRAGLRFLSISVDTAYDTPPVLKEYAEGYDSDPTLWTYLTGKDNETRALSEAGFALPTAEDPTNAAMPIAHSSRLILVDRRGRIRAYVDSQQDDSADRLLEALAPLLAEDEPLAMPSPEEVFTTPWMPARRDAQLATAASWTVDHDFSFSDRRMESGIRFRHRCVDDGLKEYKPVHYDHGNGVAAADVDGDGLVDLYFTNQVGDNELWRNLGNGRFEDITEAAGVAMPDAVRVTASFADTDNDGDEDLFVTTVRGGNRFLVNDGRGHFEDVTEASGLGYSGHCSSGVFFDYDRDGLLDLFLCNVGVYTANKQVPVGEDSVTAGRERGPATYWVGLLDGFTGHLKPERTEKSILYRNLGGNRFQDVTTVTGLVDDSWNGAATPIDVNGDGWLDLYVLNMQGRDQYYENVEGKRFVRKTREVFPKTPWGTMGVKVFDYDGDGDLDLYLTDMHSDMTHEVGPGEEKLKSVMAWPETVLRTNGQSVWGNALLRREADGSYKEVSDEVGTETYWPWGISVGDLNADGFEDVFVTAGMNYPFRYGINSLLLNDAGKHFRDAEFVLGVEPRRGPFVAPWFDLDCRTSGRDRRHLVCEKYNREGVVFSSVASRSSVMFDLDQDGDLDIVTNDFNTEPMVLVSDLAQRRTVQFLEVRLRGTHGNRDGLGAVVRVTAGGQTRVQVHDGQSGYLSQSVLPLYFGLGRQTSAERIEVTWLSGKTQVVKGPIHSGTHVVVTEE